MHENSMCTWHLQSSYTGVMCQLSHYAVLWKAWHVHCPISAWAGDIKHVRESCYSFDKENNNNNNDDDDDDDDDILHF